MAGGCASGPMNRNGSVRRSSRRAPPQGPDRLRAANRPVQAEPLRSAMSITNRTNQQISLHDGPTPGFAEYGDLAGTPVLLFNGAAARFFRHPDDQVAESL